MLISEFQVQIDFELAIANPVDDQLIANSLSAVVNSALEAWLAQRRCLCSIPSVKVIRQPKEGA
jgi:hypothetical protein